MALPAPARDLDRYSVDELRAGGVGRIGFLQPLLGGAGDDDGGAAQRAAAHRLVRRGLLVGSGSRWRVAGTLATTLGAVAAARSFAGCAPGGGSGGLDRLLFGRLGATDLVLDLMPEDGGYHARLLRIPDAAQQVVDDLGLEGTAGDATAAATDAAPEWPLVERRLDGAPVEVRIESAAIDGPERPMLQQRLQVVTTGNERWLVLGACRGAQTWRAAAPCGPGRARSAIASILAGDAVRLSGGSLPRRRHWVHSSPP